MQALAARRSVLTRLTFLQLTSRRPCPSPARAGLLHLGWRLGLLLAHIVEGRARRRHELAVRMQLRAQRNAQRLAGSCGALQPEGPQAGLRARAYEGGCPLRPVGGGGVQLRQPAGCVAVPPAWCGPSRGAGGAARHLLT
jgi:hypothetical protein